MNKQQKTMASIFPGSKYDLCLWGNLKEKVYILEQLKLHKNIKYQFVKLLKWEGGGVALLMYVIFYKGVKYRVIHIRKCDVHCRPFSVISNI
jgi:hypothetical protein